MTVHDTAHQYHADQSALPGMPEVDPFAGYEDYYSPSGVIHNYFLPDGKQYISFVSLTEGMKIKYEGMTSRDVKFSRSSDEAAIKINSGEDRKALILMSVIGWHIVRRNAGGRLELVPWDSRSATTPGGEFSQWYAKQDPTIIQGLYQAIADKNPWLSSEQTVEMIDAEILKLQEARQKAAEREAASKNS